MILALALAMPAMAADKPKEMQLSPVTAFKDGFTLEQSTQFRGERDLSAWLGGGDASVWVNLRPTEAFPSTAMAPNRRPAKELPKAINPDCAIADGVPEVLKATRENLRMGASQIKIATAGGIAEGDPLDAVEWTAEEVQAATKAAADWGTYVTTHTYTKEGALRAIENGVKCIEHGNLLDEETLRLMQKKGIWLSPQIMVFKNEIKGLNEEQKKKYDEVTKGTEHLFAMAKKMGYEKLAFGTDIVTDPKTLLRMNEEFVHRTKWFAPAEILRQATSVNAELMALSGKRNPYPGKLGVIEEGAYADILLINGDPLKDISILTKADENLALIMKDGKIYKNTVK